MPEWSRVAGITIFWLRSKIFRLVACSSFSTAWITFRYSNWFVISPEVVADAAPIKLYWSSIRSNKQTRVLTEPISTYNTVWISWFRFILFHPLQYFLTGSDEIWNLTDQNCWWGDKTACENGTHRYSDKNFSQGSEKENGIPLSTDFLSVFFAESIVLGIN